LRRRLQKKIERIDHRHFGNQIDFDAELRQVVDLVDMDGDGLKDIVTGKRFWAHGHKGSDPESDNPAVLYWFKLTRPAKGQAEFVPYLVDDNSGIGTQVVTGNISNKEFPDIVVGNKKGLFLLKHETRNVSKAEWQKAQPRKVNQ